MTQTDVNKWMLTIKLWWLQTDCQVCDSVTEFLDTQSSPFMPSGLFFHSAAFKRGERGGASFGPGVAADGSTFPLSRWRIEPPKSEGESCFAFFAQ